MIGTLPQVPLIVWGPNVAVHAYITTSHSPTLE